MKKIFLLCLFFSLMQPVVSSSLEIKTSPFRLNYLVYYHILYKMQGISMNKFKDVTVVSDKSSELVFEYEGKRYTANILSNSGAIYVTMPEGMRNRFISQSSFPAIVLVDLDRR